MDKWNISTLAIQFQWKINVFIIFFLHAFLMSFSIKEVIHYTLAGLRYNVLNKFTE